VDRKTVSTKEEQLDFILGQVCKPRQIKAGSLKIAEKYLSKIR
jgi:hypothetical protein